MNILVKGGRSVTDLSYARILYNNKLNAASSTDAAAALIPNTWERWESASGTMQATFQPATSVVINAVGIAAHNLATTGSSVVVETAPTVAGTWTERDAITPITNKPILFLFENVDDCEDVRITITGGTDREIGVIYAGEAMVMQRALYGGHNPIDLSSVTEYQNNQSDTGQFLGRTIQRKGKRSTFSWRNIEPDWYRETFQPFVDSAKTTPFFIKWRPDRFSDEVAFGYTENDITPSNSGGGIDLMNMSMSMRAHDE